MDSDTLTYRCRGLAAHAVTLMLLATQFMQWRGVDSPQVYMFVTVVNFFCQSLIARN